MHTIYHDEVITQNGMTQHAPVTENPSSIVRRFPSSTEQLAVGTGGRVKLRAAACTSMEEQAPLHGDVEALRLVAGLLLTPQGLQQGGGIPQQPPDGTHRANLQDLQPHRPVARLACVGPANQQEEPHIQRQQQQAQPQQQSRWGTGGDGGTAAAAAPPLPQQPGAGTFGLETQSQSAAARLAVSRERNRLSQQRFRERQRARQKLEGQQCAVLQQVVDEVRGGRPHFSSLQAC
jgi:hypothetical protein